jgi:hypothetical protein
VTFGGTAVVDKVSGEDFVLKIVIVFVFLEEEVFGIPEAPRGESFSSQRTNQNLSWKLTARSIIMVRHYQNVCMSWLNMVM